MIQNSLTADVLVCVDEPAHNLVGLILFSSKSRGMRRHVVLRFKRDACLAALSGQWGPNFNDISRALALSKECDEVYHCPYCHSGVSGAHCKCIYEVKRAAHPLDFSSMTLNLLSYSGNWSGLCNLNLFSNGVQYAAARLSSSASATCSFEPSIIRCDVEASIRSKMGTSSRVTSLLSSPWVAQTAPEDQNMV